MSTAVDIYHIDWRVCDRRAAYQRRDLLSSDELRRAGKYVFHEDAYKYISGRVVVREILSRYMHGAPADCRFSYNEYGKPRLADQGAHGGPVHFSLSHSKQLTILAVSLHMPVGVDIEFINGGVVERGLFSSVFSPGELATLPRFTQRQASDLFWLLWTAKEAFVKNIGIGLNRDPRTVSFNLDPLLEGKKELRLQADGEANYQFLSVETDPSSICTLAVQFSARVQHHLVTPSFFL